MGDIIGSAGSGSPNRAVVKPSGQRLTNKGDHIMGRNSSGSSTRKRRAAQRARAVAATAALARGTTECRPPDEFIPRHSLAGLPPVRTRLVAVSCRDFNTEDPMSKDHTEVRVASGHTAGYVRTDSQKVGAVIGESLSNEGKVYRTWLESTPVLSRDKDGKLKKARAQVFTNMPRSGSVVTGTMSDREMESYKKRVASWKATPADIVED